MKLAHQIEITVFSYATDDFEKISGSFLELFPFNLQEEKIKMDVSSASGFNNKGIAVLKAKLQKESHTTKLLEKISCILDKAEKGKLLRQLETRLDDELNFFMRFGKDEWINDKKLILTDSGRCFHVKASIAAFPKKRENAIEIIKRLFH